MSEWTAREKREGGREGGDKKGEQGNTESEGEYGCWKGKERDGRMKASERKTRKAERKERREGGERFCRGAPKQALEDRSPSCHEYSHAQYLGASRDYLLLNFQFHHRLPLYASCEFPFSKKLRGKTVRWREHGVSRTPLSILAELALEWDRNRAFGRTWRRMDERIARGRRCN